MRFYIWFYHINNKNIRIIKLLILIELKNRIKIKIKQGVQEIDQWCIWESQLTLIPMKP